MVTVTIVNAAMATFPEARLIHHHGAMTGGEVEVGVRLITIITVITVEVEEVEEAAVDTVIKVEAMAVEILITIAALMIETAAIEPVAVVVVTAEAAVVELEEGKFLCGGNFN